MIKPVKENQGVAIVVVLVFCMAVLGFLTVLFMNTRAQRGTQESQYDQTRALLAAKAAAQLAIYKYRVLPSEFYKIHQLELAVRSGTAPADAGVTLNSVKGSWLEDFDTQVGGSPASIIKNQLDQSAGGDHNFAVEEFALVSREQRGYIKDYLKIRTWGSFGLSRKVIEELIEVKIAK